MNRKTLIWFFLAVFSAIGGYLPTLFGADYFSFWSIITTALGGFFGIWLGFRLGE